MAKVYTLRNREEGNLEHLNGKMFLGKIMNNGSLVLTEVVSDSVIRVSTSVVEKKVTEDGVIIRTESGQLYDLINVKTLLPSAQAQEPEQAQEIKPESKFKLEDETHVNRDIHYGDGYSGTVYRFDRAISYEEFVDFCINEVGIKLYKTTGYAWYEDHSAIIIGAVIGGNRWTAYEEGHPGKESKVWTYLWIRAYTD